MENVQLTSAIRLGDGMKIYDSAPLVCTVFKAEAMSGT